MATRIGNSVGKQNVEVSLAMGDVGLINLSGSFKSKAGEIVAKWNQKAPIISTLEKNTFGKGNGFVILTSNDDLVGFLNFFEANGTITLEEADKAFRSSTFAIATSKVDMDCV